VNLDRKDIHVLAVNGDPENVWALPTERIETTRTAMLRPFDVCFQGPARTALYLFDDRSWVAESFHEEPITVTANGQEVDMEANGWAQSWR